MDESTIMSWTEAQLLEKIYHELRQSSTIASGFAELLADGTFGFANDKQRSVLQDLLYQVNSIKTLNRWMEVWFLSRKTNM